MTAASPIAAKPARHYDADYFAWQRDIGAFGGLANKIKFEAFVEPSFNVIDFGCGGGYLLDNLTCDGKIGIEVNPAAAEQARAKGLTVCSQSDEVPDEWADLIVSNNALEHTTDPLDELRALWTKLRRDGRLVLVVPCEAIGYRYKPADINQHLYSWSPMSIGNLCMRAGYEVIRSEPFIHKWPPGYVTIRKWFGLRIFHALCGIYGHLERSWFQVRVVARRP